MERSRVRIFVAVLLSGWMVGAAAAMPKPGANALTGQALGVFQTPLIPFGPSTVAETRALETAVAEYRAAGDAARTEALDRFLLQHPHTTWRVALLTNEGLAYKHAGEFSKALAHLQAAWAAGRSASTAPQKALAEQAYAELLKLHTALGHPKELKTLLAQSKGRVLSGPARVAKTIAQEGLWRMQHEPGSTYLCGVVALRQLLTLQSGSHGASPLEGVQAGPHGISLARLQRLAVKAGLQADMVHRRGKDPIPVPAIVHWRVGHYATIVGQSQGRFHIQDPAVGDLWMSRAAVKAESSGYFLVPGKAAAKRPWQRVARSEARQIIGAGLTGSNNPDMTSDDDKDVCGCGGGSASSGMARYSVKAMLVSLSLHDTPVGYTPPKGPAVPVTLVYSQREANQPANFTFFNLGHKWTSNWLSYVQDNPVHPGNDVMIYLRGGGSRHYDGYNGSTGAFAREERTGAHLVRVSSSPLVYERRLPDGSKEVYGASDDSTYYPRRIFLTRVVDPAGNAVTLSYDEKFRLTSLTDALGQRTTFQYDNAKFPRQITGVTDPFGRTAAISYDGSGRLIRITDALGMQSQFTYNSGTFITALITPYGTTHFAGGQSGTTRWLVITDPEGKKERVEYRHNAAGIPFSDSPVPAGIKVFNRYINARNTYFWDKTAMERAPGNYTQAQIYHWLHERNRPYYGSTAEVLESIKAPLERRIWYNYPNQNWAGGTGGFDKPSAIARVLDDGTTQVRRFRYNAYGRVTRASDPVGREVDYSYAANGIDLVKITLKTASGTNTLAKFTYNDQHKPLSYTDAAGQTTTYSYNSAGQLTAETNPLGQTTRYEYDDQGYLLAVIDPNGITQARYTYDEAGRLAGKTDAAGYTLRYRYDALDRLVRTTYPDGTHTDVTWEKLDVARREDRYGDVTHYAYDSVRNLLSQIDPSGHTTRYGYFSNGALASITDGKGNATQIERDIQRRKTRITRADDGQTTFHYDHSGRLVRRTDALGGATVYTYGRDDRLSSVTDPAGNTTTYHYDPYTGKLIGRDSPDTGVTRYSYDVAGRLISQTDANGNTITHQYDALNRLVRTDYGDGRHLEYAYDTAPNGVGRLAEVGGPDGSTAFEYDERGHVVKRTQTAADGTVLVLNTDYTDAGLPQRLTYPSGAVVDYHYQHDRLAGIQVNGQTVLEDLTYAPFGPVAGWSWGNGESNRRSYDADGQLESYTVGADVRSLTYDTVGNITAIAGGNLNQHFNYDALDRLTAANADDFDLGYAYDANGNRTEARDGTTTSAYRMVPGSNRLAAIDATAYQYDANGNVVADGRHSYRYDARNRLVSVDDGMTAAYGYNPFGQRVEKTATRRYQLTADLNGDGQVTEADLHVLQGYIRSHQAPPEADLNQDGQVDGKDTPCIATRVGDDKNQGKGQSSQGNKGRVALTPARWASGSRRPPKPGLSMTVPICSENMKATARPGRRCVDG